MSTTSYVSWQIINRDTVNQINSRNEISFSHFKSHLASAERGGFFGA